MNSKSLIFVWNRYHVPRSWFKPSGNVLVIFEEKGGDPLKIEFSRRKISGVGALAAEDYPSIDLESWHEGNGSNKSISTVNLKCPENTHISTVKFASFGNPTGSCGSYTKGDCHDPNSISVVEKVSTSNFLVGDSNCLISFSNQVIIVALLGGGTCPWLDTYIDTI